jgi:hypothetical protein
VDPQSRSAEFSAARGPGRLRFGILVNQPRCRAGLRRVHFPRTESHNRFGERSHAGKGCRCGRSRPYQPSPASRRQTEEPPRVLRPPSPPGEFDWERLGNRVSRPLSRDRRGAGRARYVIGLVASLSAFHPTRLETRTKESNMRASHWVVRNPKAQ